MGRTVALDLARTEKDAEVTLFDVNEEYLASAKEYAGSGRVSTKILDIADIEKAVRLLKEYDVSVASLPHGLSLFAIEASVKAGISIVDMVGSFPEKRIEQNGIAKKAGCTVIPACGVAPGISNMCAGRGIELLDETTDVYIYVGGIPVKKEPPFFYQTVYLMDSVFNMYTRKCNVKIEGSEVEIEPLTGCEIIQFPEPIGKLEAFFTDGLSSLKITLKDRVKNSLFEKTLRYPGHLDCIKVLKSCGLLETQPIKTDDKKVIPRDVLMSLLRDKFKLGPEGDILVMRVIVKGKKDGRSVSHNFELIDYYDSDTKTTAMARTTGYPAAIAARLIANREITERGVIFPEQIFCGKMYNTMISELASRGVHLTEKETD